MVLLFVFLMLFGFIGCQREISYPIRFTYVNRLDSWWPEDEVLKGMGVPGYAAKTDYNCIALSFWTSDKEAMDLAKVWELPVKYLGKKIAPTHQATRYELKKRYNQNGIKLFLAVFGATDRPTTNKTNPVQIADRIASFVSSTGFDGIDVNWEDTESLVAGTGEKWLISFMKRLRRRLPSILISHSPQGPYFDENRYPGGGYMKVHEEVGQLIDFYNIQYYNQMSLQYNTYKTLFLESSPGFSGHSIKELMEKNIPGDKLVIGKPVKKADAINTGWVQPNILGNMIARGQKELKWHGGVMLWQYSSDQGGQAIRQVAGQLISASEKNTSPASGKNDERIPLQPAPKQPPPTQGVPVQPQKPTAPESRPSTGTTEKETTNIEEQVVEFSNAFNINLPKIEKQQKSSNIQDSASPRVFTISGQIQVTFPPDPQTVPSQIPPAPSAASKLNYPVKLSYVNKISSWWPEQSVLKALGVPEYTEKNVYNYLSYTYWSYSKDTADVATVWKDPLTFLGKGTEFGQSNQDIRKNILKRFHSYGISLLLSAFGPVELAASTNSPTSISPEKCAEKLAAFVVEYKFDGVDINWKDTRSFLQRKGEGWLIKFSRKLRSLLPGQTIIHTVQSPYFNEQMYPGGGYMEVHRKVGHLIDGYVVQYFDQNDLKYDTFYSLFYMSSTTKHKQEEGTAVKELMHRGIPKHKIIIGKPATQSDAANTGWISSPYLAWAFNKAYYDENLQWWTGVALWQYSSDTDNNIILSASKTLQLLCSAYKNCGVDS